jgi:hypothetical protein
MTDFSSRSSPQPRADIADTISSTQSFPFVRADFQRDTASQFSTLIGPPKDPVAVFLSMPESEQKRAMELLDSSTIQQIERAKLHRALTAVVGLRESEILAKSDLPNDVLQEVLLNSNKLPYPRNHEVGELSIGHLVERSHSSALSVLQKLSDSELKQILVSSNVTEMSNLPPEISKYIFSRLQEDPKVILDIQRKQYENEYLPGLKNIRDGSYKIATEVEERLQNALLPDMMSFQNSGGRLELEGWKQRASSASQSITRHIETLKTSHAHERVAQLLSIVAEQGSASQKALIEPHIVKNLNNASGVLFLDSQSFNPSAGVDKIVRAGQMYSTSAYLLDIGVNGMEVTRDGAFMVVAAGAATLAAPVVFGAAAAAGAGVALSTVASVATGAVVGAAVDGTLTAVTEAVAAPTHVALGNKTVEQARHDFFNDVKNGAQRGGVAGLQGGATALVRVGLLSYMGNPETLSIAQTLGIAAVSSATGRAAAIPLERIQQFVELRSEFNERYGNLPLNDDAKAERFRIFLESNGFSVEGISQQALKDILFSAATSAIGARFQIARQSAANPSLAQNLKSEGAEFATNVTLGVTKAYLDTPADRRTFATLINQSIGEVFSAMTGAMQGRATGAATGTRSRDIHSGSPQVIEQGAVLPSEMKVVSHGGIESVRQKYTEMALAQIEQVHKRPANQEERVAIEEFAKGVHSFWDKNNKQMHIAETDAEIPPSLKAMHEALIAHEKAHASGKNEVEALEIQAQVLAERGYAMAFVGDEIYVTKAEEGTQVALPTRSEVSDYVTKRYSRAEELAPGLAAGNQGVLRTGSRKLLTSSDPEAEKIFKKYNSTNAPLAAPPDATCKHYNSMGGDCKDYHWIYFDTKANAVNLKDRTEVPVNVEVRQYWHIDPALPPNKQDSWRAQIIIDLSDAKFAQYPPGTKVQVILPGSNGKDARVWVTVPPTTSDQSVQFELVSK